MMLLQEQKPVRDVSEKPGNKDMLLRNTRNEISRLRRLSTRGLRALSLFLLISILSWLNFP